MATIQKRAKVGKHLKRGKKLEATRPLKGLKAGGSTTSTPTPSQSPYFTITMQDVKIP